MVDFLNNFATQHPWVPLAITGYLVFVKAVQGLRDAFDKTPLTDDTKLEHIATIIVKVGGYLVGIRPKAPPAATPVPGALDNAAGVKTEVK